MNTTNISTLVNHIELGLQRGSAPYITAVDCDGEKIKIRVSDHSSNDRNNNGMRCISFITNRTVRNSGHHENATEWVMEYNEDTEQWNDNNYQTIEDILSDFCLVGVYENGELVKF